jgi:hypothetical protein
MLREEKRARGGVAIRFALPPRVSGDSLLRFIAARCGRSSYRSTLDLLEYGLAGRAIITTAIASPANNDKTSILLTHLRVRTFVDRFPTARDFKVDCPFSTGSPNRTCETTCAFRAVTRASIYEVTQERCGKPMRSRYESFRNGFFPCVVCDALLTGSRTRERCTPG